jgi:hypothetical protein
MNVNLIFLIGLFLLFAVVPVFMVRAMRSRKLPRFIWIAYIVRRFITVLFLVWFYAAIWLYSPGEYAFIAAGALLVSAHMGCTVYVYIQTRRLRDVSGATPSASTHMSSARRS